MNDLETALAALPAAIAGMDRLRKRVDVKRRLIELTVDEVNAEPYLVWNAFITLLGALPYESMTEVQRSAHLAFHYDAEVQNGGHFQFFVNNAERPHRDVAAALDHLSTPAHANLFRNAHARWRSQPRSSPMSAEDCALRALGGEFADIDSAYNQLRPTISDALQSLLDGCQAEFVHIKR